MPNALHAALSSHQRHRLQELRHDPALKPRERDRVEALLLSAAGMRVPQLAAHFGCCEATVRRWLHQFTAEGLQFLRHRQRGLGPDVARRQAVHQALTGLLSQKRTWTVVQLAEALAERGLVMKPRTVRKYLKLMGARYRRTTATMRPRQDPARVVSDQTELDNPNQKPAPGTWTSSASTRPAAPSPNHPLLPGTAGSSPASATNTPGTSA